MRLTPTSPGIANLQVTGQITVTSGVSAATYIGNANQLTNLNASQLSTGIIPTARLVGTYNINIAGNVSGNVTGDTQGTHTGPVIGNVTGTASGNLSATGGTLTGDLNWSTTGRGLTWGMNTDGASIRFYNTGDGDAASRLEFQTTDNGNEYFSWTHNSGSTFESMRLVPNSSGNATLTVFGNATINGTTTGTFSGVGTALTLNAGNLTTGTVPSARLTGTYAINITGNSNTAILATTATNISGGSVNATTATFSGQVNVSTAGIRFPNDPYGGSGDAASITYESVSGEKTRLRFRVTNDPGITAVDDKAEFIVPDNDSLLVNGYVTLNAANYNGYSPTLTGGNASGTWGINVTGSAGSAGSVAWTGITGKPNIVLNDGSTYGINISGNANTASSTSVVNNSGNITAETDGFGEPSGLRLRSVYSNGYPTSYGNAITLGGAGGGELLIGWSGSTGSHADNYVRSRRDTGNVWSAWAKLITDVNYNSYSPTLTGGGASGTWGINITGNANTVTTLNSTQIISALGFAPVGSGSLTNQSGTALTGSTAALSGKLTVAAGSDKGIHFPNDAFGGGSDTARITLETAGGEATRMRFTMTNDADDYFEFSTLSVDGLKMNGNTVLNAANYSSYSPTLTGGNASGTWGINITGNAASVSAISYQQVVNALGYPPANQSDLTRVTTSPLQATNITTTGTLTLAQGSDKGIRWPNDAFGGGGDTASITLENAYGTEAQRLTIRVTNDSQTPGPGDEIVFDTPGVNGVSWASGANNYPFYHWANIQFTSGTNYSSSGFTNQVGSFNFGANHFDVYPPGGYSMGNLVAFIPSIHVIHFAGGVDGNDSLVCTWSNLGDRIRVYVQNTEQRSTPAANWLAIWRR
jgi:hypothetical protein